MTTIRTWVSLSFLALLFVGLWLLHPADGPLDHEIGVRTLLFAIPVGIVVGYFAYTAIGQVVGRFNWLYWGLVVVCASAYAVAGYFLYAQGDYERAHATFSLGYMFPGLAVLYANTNDKKQDE